MTEACLQAEVRSRPKVWIHHPGLLTQAWIQPRAAEGGE